MSSHIEATLRKMMFAMGVITRYQSHLRQGYAQHKYNTTISHNTQTEQHNATLCKIRREEEEEKEEEEKSKRSKKSKGVTS